MWTYTFFWHSQGCVVSDSFPHCYTSWPKTLGSLSREVMRHLFFFIFFGKPQIILNLVYEGANTHISNHVPLSSQISILSQLYRLLFFFLAAELCLSICLLPNAICRTPMCIGPCSSCFRSLINSQLLPGSLHEGSVTRHRVLSIQRDIGLVRKDVVEEKSFIVRNKDTTTPF